MYVISLDIGGTKIEGAVVDEKGKIVLNKRIATEAGKGRKHVLRNIFLVIEYLKNNFNKKICGVGIAIPGFVSVQGKMIFCGGTLTFLKDINLKSVVARKTHLPVFVENDANCFALAEAYYGAGKNKNIVIGVIWGTGIGGGVIINKNIYSGAQGGAGEFGHIIIDPNVKKGHRCGCGQYGCLENLCSGKNISRLYKEGGGKIHNANPRQIYFSKEKVAKDVIDKAIFYLGLGLSMLVQNFNPDIIVIGAGVSQLPSPVYKRLRAVVKKYSLLTLTKNLKIVRYAISEDAGVVGAAALAFSSLNKIK